MSLKSLDKMLPHEIITSRENCGLVFIPVSPCFEWHSYHLPIGTDALISEKICELVAEKVGGIYFNILPFGLDNFRKKDELKNLGFKKRTKIFGMNFPDLPLLSEYCKRKEMILCIKNRLEVIRDSKFKAAFIVSHHSSNDQITLLEEISNNFNSIYFKVKSIDTLKFCTIKSKNLETGGHAGIAETQWMLAFCPDLVDLKQINVGRLVVKDVGILHNQPIIEEKYNPRNVSNLISAKLRKNVIDNLVDYINKRYLTSNN